MMIVSQSYPLVSRPQVLPNTKPGVVTVQCWGIEVYCNDREFCDRTHIVITLSFAWCQLVWGPKLIH